MQYKLGNFKSIEERGQTTLLTCPKCNKKVKFSVFKNEKVELVSQMPLVKSDRVYFLVCPECASVFGVDSDKADSLYRGSDLSIGNFDFKDLEIFNDKS